MTGTEGEEQQHQLTLTSPANVCAKPFWDTVRLQATRSTVSALRVCSARGPLSVGLTRKAPRRRDVSLKMRRLDWASRQWHVGQGKGLRTAATGRNLESSRAGSGAARGEEPGPTALGPWGFGQVTEPLRLSFLVCKTETTGPDSKGD